MSLDWWREAQKKSPKPAKCHHDLQVVLASHFIQHNDWMFTVIIETANTLNSLTRNFHHRHVKPAASPSIIISGHSQVIRRRWVHDHANHRSPRAWHIPSVSSGAGKSSRTCVNGISAALPGPEAIMSTGLLATYRNSTCWAVCHSEDLMLILGEGHQSQTFSNITQNGYKKKGLIFSVL